MNICKFACSFRASAVVFSCTLQNPRFIRCSVRLKPISHSDRKRDFFRRIKINKISERCWRIPPFLKLSLFLASCRSGYEKLCSENVNSNYCCEFKFFKNQSNSMFTRSEKTLMSLVPKRCQIHCKLRVSKFAEVQKRNWKSARIGSLLGFKNNDCMDI